eukprot:scaffold58693_cov72-Phaeocystis_antarctica.AAC.3
MSTRTSSHRAADSQEGLCALAGGLAVRASAGEPRVVQAAEPRSWRVQRGSRLIVHEARTRS